jgi:RNA polymerase sigma-70 factor (ECF subfamily)
MPLPAMQQQNTEQLARLWTESQPVVASYIISLVPNFHQAEDVLQQVAVVLVREFEKYDPDRPFLPWAMGIAKNVALKSRRQAAVESLPLIDAELVERVQAAFEEHAENWAPFRRALRECLQHQKARMRDVLQLRYAHDMKPQAVARQMGITSGAVRVLLHRAREALRECIQRKTEMHT